MLFLLLDHLRYSQARFFWPVMVIAPSCIDTNKIIAKRNMFVKGLGFTHIRREVNIVTDLLKALSLWSQKTPLLCKHVQTNTRPTIQERCFLCGPCCARCYAPLTKHFTTITDVFSMDPSRDCLLRNCAVTRH
jgi:hypothetical protein